MDQDKDGMKIYNTFFRGKTRQEVYSIMARKEIPGHIAALEAALKDEEEDHGICEQKNRKFFAEEIIKAKKFYDERVVALEAVVKEKEKYADEVFLSVVGHHEAEMKDVKERIATLTAELDVQKHLVDSHRARHIFLDSELIKLTAENEQLKAALGFILPMAKGYAADHNVGRNREIVNEVQNILKGEKEIDHD